MRAAVLDEFGGDVTVRDVPQPEYVVLPARNLVGVPEGLGLDEAAIAADAIATPYHVIGARRAGGHPRGVSRHGGHPGLRSYRGRAEVRPRS